MSDSIENMIKQQLRPWGVTNQVIIDLFQQTSRSDFLPEQQQDLAYADTNLPINDSQIMLAPKYQARILQELDIKPHDIVFEIGTGTGFLTTLIAQLANNVYSAELDSTLFEQAKANIAKRELKNVQLFNKDAWHDWASLTSQGHYDVILSTSAFYEKPEKLLQKLSINGRLFAIIGNSPAMSAVLFTRVGEETWQQQFLFETVVPYVSGIPSPETFEFLERKAL